VACERKNGVVLTVFCAKKRVGELKYGMSNPINAVTICFIILITVSSCSNCFLAKEATALSWYGKMPDPTFVVTPVMDQKGQWTWEESVSAVSGLYNVIQSEWSDNSLLAFEVNFPKGSYDPGSMLRLGQKRGGFSFKTKSFPTGRECAWLRYRVRFDKDFDFVKGGKLPGLYGWWGNSGGLIPNGYDGFSIRVIWLGNGDGAVYAYLPTSKVWGTALARREWRFEPGKWYLLELQVLLNRPFFSDGVIRISIDNKVVREIDKLVFRKTNDLLIDGMMFSTFFGGNNSSFASSADAKLSFSSIQLSGANNCR